MADHAQLGVRDVLRIPDYRRLFGGQLISDIGDGITLFLVLLVINELTDGSTVAIALMAIAEAVPAFTVGLAAGVYVDRWDRRKVMLASDLLRAAIVLAFAFVQTPALIPLFYVLGFVQASIATFFRPARGALLPHIVPAEGLAAANSLAQISQVIGSVVGTGLAGLIFATLGSGFAGFAIDSATFLISFVLVAGISPEAGRVTVERAAAVAGESILGGVTAGLRVVRGSRVLTGVLLAAGITMLGLGAVNVLFVPLLIGDLEVNPAWMAAVELAQTVGMILAAGTVVFLARRLAPTTIISLGLAVIGACIGLVAGVNAVWQVILILFAVGVALTPLQAMVQTIVQTAAGDATRGRVVSVLQASISTASVASMAIGGVLGAVIGIRAVYLVAAGVVLAAAGLSVLLFRGESGRPVQAAAPAGS